MLKLARQVYSKSLPKIPLLKSISIPSVLISKQKSLALRKRGSNCKYGKAYIPFLVGLHTRMLSKYWDIWSASILNISVLGTKKFKYIPTVKPYQIWYISFLNWICINYFFVPGIQRVEPSLQQLVNYFMSVPWRPYTASIWRTKKAFNMLKIGCRNWLKVNTVEYSRVFLKLWGHKSVTNASLSTIFCNRQKHKAKQNVPIVSKSLFLHFWPRVEHSNRFVLITIWVKIRTYTVVLVLK